MPEQENSLTDLKKYLSTPEQPVSTQEMYEFWTSLTDEEKEEFKSTVLDK
jgi:hypothetical protein